MATEDRLSRAALAAIGAAGVALVLAVVAAVVVLGRDAPDTPAKASGLIEVEADAAAIRGLLESSALTEVPKGLALADPAAIGLEPGDVLTTIGGIPLHTASDLRMPLRRASRRLAGARAILVEIDRGGQSHVVRIALRGDLAAATHPQLDLTRPSLTPDLPVPPPTLVPDPDAPIDPSPPFDSDAVIAGISRIDDTHYLLSRDAIDKILGNPMAAARGARVMPSVKNGQPNGFKLYAIRPSSFYAKLGFENGDTVGSINDMELTSMDQALEVYSQLRSATVLDFEIIRRGQPVTLTITIR